MIYKKQDIDRIFTEKVSELIAQGFQINPATMGGSQGEIACVDLCRGDEILRVRLESSSGWGCDPEYLSLTVGLCTEPICNGSFCHDAIIWNNRLEILSEIKFASATFNLYDTPVYLDMASGQEADEKRKYRWRARYLPNRHKLPDAAKSIALRWLRKQNGFKSCRLSEIESVTRIDREDGSRYYEIKARGKAFALCPHKSA